MKHPVFISVLLSHMIREYSIPFLRTFSRGTDPFWLAPHVTLHNMSRIYRMLFIVFVPCFHMLPLYLYSHLFLCFLIYRPVFVRFCHIFSSGLFFSCFPVSTCIPVCFYVFPCIPMFSPACFPTYPPVFLCFALYQPFFMSSYFPLVFLFFSCFPRVSYVSPCFPMYPCFLMFCHVFLCAPLFSYVFQCSPLYSYVFKCFSLFFNVFPRFSIFSPAHPFFPMFSNVFLCFIPLFSYVHVLQITTQVVETSITSNTNSPQFHPDDHTQPTYVHHVTMLWLKNGIKYCCS